MCLRKYKEVITITNEDYGFFNPNYFDNNETIVVDRSKLSQEDKFMLLKIKNKNNIQH